MLDRQKYRQTAVTSNAKYYFETTVLTVKHVDLKSLLTIHSKPYLTRSRVHNYKLPSKTTGTQQCNFMYCILDEDCFSFYRYNCDIKLLMFIFKSGMSVMI